MGVIGGLVAAVVGAGAWAVITVVTEYQIAWMAIGIGCLVGLTVRGLGKGISPVFGLVGAGCALLGCVLGNLMSICGFASVNESIPFFEALGLVLSNPSLTMELMTATFSPIDVLFYGIAVYEGYKFSIRQTA
ncbi:MAG: hypothetical protein GY794_23390 [bacterium]|nr:hypothetical protein [bacterium]